MKKLILVVSIVLTSLLVGCVQEKTNQLQSSVDFMYESPSGVTVDYVAQDGFAVVELPNGSSFKTSFSEASNWVNDQSKLTENQSKLLTSYVMFNLKTADSLVGEGKLTFNESKYNKGWVYNHGSDEILLNPLLTMDDFNANYGVSDFVGSGTDRYNLFKSVL